MPSETLDLVTQKPDGTFVLVLVEKGPWPDEPIVHLRKIQERLYNYIDIAIDGHLAALYPESRGKFVLIRVDAYDTPQGAVREFVERFVLHVEGSAEIQDAVARQDFVSALDFECNERELD